MDLAMGLAGGLAALLCSLVLSKHEKWQALGLVCCVVMTGVFFYALTCI